jgi:hypothetical protein
LTIDAYLEALRRRLPWFGRRRALAEVREHLRDSATRHEASGLEPDAAERASVQEFGDVDTIAPRFAAEAAVLETRVASAVALVAVAVFVFPLYVVPENTLPPAMWTQKPTDILVLQIVTVALWIVAGAFAALAACLAWTRWPRLVVPALALGLGALAASALFSAVLVVRWDDASDAAAWPLLATPLALACLAVTGLALAWTRRRSMTVCESSSH